MTREDYLIKHYEHTAAEYQALLDSQGGGCAVCGFPPKTRPLDVDHSHAFANKKVSACGVSPNWKAWADGTPFVGYGKKRAEAVHDVKRQLLKASVRGLLCHRCNQGIQFFRDNPDRLRTAASYLERFNNNG